jgi:hypothetical protein
VYRIYITKLEDLSNELFYEIFDYLDDVKSFEIFLPLNKRFFSLLFDSRRMLTLDLRDQSKSQPDTFYRDIVIPQRHRIRSLKLGDEQIDIALLNTYCIDSSFLLLESVTLNSNSTKYAFMLPHLAKLPCLSCLSINIEITLKTLEFVVFIYQTILSFKSLNYLTLDLEINTPDEDVFSYADGDSSDEDDGYVDASGFVAINQEPSNLQNLCMKHSIDTEGFLKIINYTPKLRRLSVQSLRGYIPSQIIPKLPQLTELIIEDSKFDCESLESLLDAFDCQLQTLEIGTRLPDEYHIDERWEQLMKRRFSRLKTFTIRLEPEWMNLDVEMNSFDCIHFICHPFWYDHGWMADINIGTTSIEGVFCHTK